MTAASAIFGVTIVSLCFVIGLIYQRFWKLWYGTKITPTGFGVILSFVLLGSSIVNGLPNDLAITFVIISLAAIVYWFDDAIELSARLRMIICFVTGMTIATVLTSDNYQFQLILILAICLGSGLLNVVFTNIVNFYDGADLNLATFIILTAVLLLIYSPMGSLWFQIAIACLSFIVPFAVMNSRPKTIYLGDSGSFVFAGLLTVVIVSHFYDLESSPVEALIPLALPALDCFFVVLIRIREKHNLLTRNYLHLYQRLNQHHSGFGYLLPQLFNTLFCLLFASVLQAAGVARILSVLIAMAVITIPFYLVCRWLFVNRKDCNVVMSEKIQ